MFRQWLPHWEDFCYLCRKKSSAGFLCASCCAEIAWLATAEANCALCQRCGVELWPTANDGQTPDYCTSCRQLESLLGDKRRIPFTRNYALAYYQGPFEALLSFYKFQKELSIGTYFSTLLARAYQQYFRGYYLVPIPPRSEKLKQEAWDQVGYLAKILHKHYHISVLPLLHRNSGEQHKALSRSDRLAAMLRTDQYQLALNARRLAWLAYRKHGPIRLLLLDDVYTTGSTIDSCHYALQTLIDQNWVAELRSLCLCLVP